MMYYNSFLKDNDCENSRSSIDVIFRIRKTVQTRGHNKMSESERYELKLNNITQVLLHEKSSMFSYLKKINYPYAYECQEVYMDYILRVSYLNFSFTNGLDFKKIDHFQNCLDKWLEEQEGKILKYIKDKDKKKSSLKWFDNILVK
ncbi:hypothetical protein DF185_09325 [Marinifilum breve]|uniref:Uncharacterized protein n=2 Tax=Marinifilum breve TaxID=2184082 RepID=A0A2V3ZZ07_9BACT|nr:hypothetical protein DF185_09325 [Marinifilum breve]